VPDCNAARPCDSAAALSPASPSTRRATIRNNLMRGNVSFGKVELYLLKGVLLFVFVYELYQFVKFVVTH
jgi:hypothetical protein